jgi:hypothetical protein
MNNTLQCPKQDKKVEIKECFSCENKCVGFKELRKYLCLKFNNDAYYNIQEFNKALNEFTDALNNVLNKENSFKKCCKVMHTLYKTANEIIKRKDKKYLKSKLRSSIKLKRGNK